MQTVIKVLDPAANEVNVRGTKAGQVYTAEQAMIWTAKGYGYSAMATAAVAALVVRPTTTAMLTLFNNSGNKNFVIERVFGHNLVAAAQSDYGLWLCVHPVGMTAPTNDITVRNSMSGKASGGNGIVDVGATVLDNGWFPWDISGTTVTVTTPGRQIEASVKGRIILPPTAAISLHVVASVTGATFTCGFHWFEVPQDDLNVN